MPPEPLDPYPEDELGCFGPVEEGPGYYGQCCVSALCYQPEPGAACVATTEVSPILPGYPPGSGTCACGVDGPYANTASPDSSECCYLVGSIGCDGRPLLVDGRARVAEVVRRADWQLPVG